MSENTIPACAEGTTITTLSAWHDGALSPVEAERMARHIRDCAACRARLAEYDAIAESLCAIYVPDPVGGYGRNPRLLPSTARRPRNQFSSRTRLRTVGGLGAVAAVLLIALAFAQVFAGLSGGSAVSRTPAPATAITSTSATPIAGPPLAWVAHAPLPDGVSGDTCNGCFNSFTIAHSDGTSAYACVVTPPPTDTGQPAAHQQTQVWITHDAGSQWTRALTISDQADATSCVVTADDDDPSLVVATSAWAFRTGPPLPDRSVTYVSHTGGATWQRLPGLQIFVQLASTQSAVYAIRQVQTASQGSSSVTSDLAVSHDGMRTWTAIDSSIVGQSGHQYVPQHFWLDPYNGDLLLETMDQSDNDTLILWHSEDSGHHWTPFGRVIPGVVTGDFIVQPSAEGQSWHVCAATYDPSGQGGNDLACTTDDGASWTQRPALDPPAFAQVKAGRTPPTVGAALVFALTDDGAVLAYCVSAQAADGSVTGHTLFRLPQGASRWQSLGPVPEFTVFYAPAPGSGMLWSVPISDIAPDPHNHRVFTVPYPPA